MTFYIPAGLDGNDIRQFINGGGGASLYDPGRLGPGELGIRSWEYLNLHFIQMTQSGITDGNLSLPAASGTQAMTNARYQENKS